MKPNVLNIAKFVVMGISLAATVASSIIAGKELDNKIAEAVAKATAESTKVES
jgi:hypothetical protein